MVATVYDIINRRFVLNFSDDPNEVLEPIWGYAREPLVSLREACAPLHNIVSRLEPHILVALENSKKPSDNLTQDESAAIRLYTMEWEPMVDEPDGSLYTHLNRTLRESNRSGLRPWFRYLKLLLTGLAKIPIAQRQVIWRGVRKDDSDAYVPGSRVTWWPFSSCTTSLNVLESEMYLGNTGTRTLFSIEALNGRTIREHSRFKTEDEILLLPGTYLEVLSRVNPASDLHIVHLRQVRPPHELLEPPFRGASLLPISPEADAAMEIFEKHGQNRRSRYKKKRVWITAIIVVLLIILAIILGAVLGTRKTNNQSSAGTGSDDITVAWSAGYWAVRNEANSQPGSSSWSSNNVILDPVLGLIMRLTQDSVGKWWCAQVKSQLLYTFGNFTFLVNASIDKFDPNVELRMFAVRSDDQTDEISIDLSRRGQIVASSPFLWYTVYPTTENGPPNTNSTPLATQTGTYTTHRFNWTTSIVSFEAGYDFNRPDLIFYRYSTDTSWSKFVPQTSAYVVISLCTYNGSAPLNGQGVEVNMRQFYWTQN